MSKPVLLVDARNALYRAIYAVKADRRYDVKYHYFVAFLRQITQWIQKFDPGSVHIFWDAPRETVWRRDTLPTYKKRPKTNAADISEDLATTTNIAQEFFKYMNVRQFSRKRMEADDLIFAAVSMLHPDETVIISTDSDMLQIPYTYNSSLMYNPKKAKRISVPEVNPVLQKALVGDKADAIDGYFNIGPVKSSKLLVDHSTLQDFLQTEGEKLFYRNMLLIDLSLCPHLFINKMYIQRQLAKPVSFCKETINGLIMKYKVNGLLQEFANLVPPFQQLI